MYVPIFIMLINAPIIRKHTMKYIINANILAASAGIPMYSNNITKNSVFILFQLPYLYI